MSREDSAEASTPKLGYILANIFLTLASYGLCYAVPWAVVIVLYWPLSLSDIFTSSVPDVKAAVLWQGRLCVPSMLVSPTNPGVMQPRLTIVDLKTQATREISLPGVGPDLRLVEDGSVLWGVSGSDVIRIEGNDVQKIATGTTLKDERPFLYDGKLAVILQSKNVLDELPKSYLHVWTGSGWKNIGHVLLPPVVDEDVIAEHAKSMVKLPLPILFDGAIEIVVVNFAGHQHLFCSDGTRTLYSPHLEVIPLDTPSAMVPENAPSSIARWTLVGPYRDFQAGADAQGLLLIETGKTGFKGATVMTNGAKSTVKVLRLVDAAWKEAYEIEEKVFVIESTLIADSQKAYLVSQTIRETLSVAEIGASGSKTSQVSVNSGPTSKRLQKAIQNLWWIYWTVLLIHAWLMTQLMNAYCTKLYEYGDTTVELAPYFRRVVAKLVDLLLIGVPIMLVNWICIGSQSQQEEWWVELFASLDFRRIALIVLGYVTYLFAWLVALGVSEGLWGVSPGKWLLGLRVLRTTVRPCGFSRAFLREIFMLADGFFGCFWPIGAFTSTMTSCRQRLGDLISDTIVIRNPSQKL